MSDWVAAPLIIAAVIALAAVMTILTRAFDQVRIREYVEQRGVKVVDIQRRIFGPGWFGSGSERIYDVSYETSHGKVHTATCKTSMFAGVYWTGHIPVLMEQVDPDPTRDVAGEEPAATPAESITCLSCGTEIPARQTQCPKCGWSYKKD